MLQYIQVFLPTEQARPWIMVKNVDFNQNYRSLLVKFNYQIHNSFTHFDLFQFWLDVFEKISNSFYNTLLILLQLLKEASLVVLAYCCELIVIEETSNFLHPLTIYPLTTPNIN